ncbi:MAG: hypothetical protein WBY66_08535, partial [Candidatus Acidiferrales bacterium]
GKIEVQHVPVSQSSNPSSKGYGLCSALPIASNNATFPKPVHSKNLAQVTNPLKTATSIESRNRPGG